MEELQDSIINSREQRRMELEAYVKNVFHKIHFPRCVKARLRDLKEVYEELHTPEQLRYKPNEINEPNTSNQP